MGNLNLNQLKERLKSPLNRDALSRAASLERRLRFHTETNLHPRDVSEPVREFLLFVEKVLPKDKYQIFLQLFRFPLPTPAVIEDVYRELERVFYSRNSSKTYRFTSSAEKEDWSNYRQTKLGEPNIWKTKAWKQLQVAPNSVVIVDLPSEQKGEKPEPYFYWLDVTDVIDFSSPDGVNLEWIIVKQPKNQIAVFDSSGSRIYQLKKDSTYELESSAPIREATHDLGYCTARFFWSTELTKSDVILKKNPITKELANLDWLLFYMLSKRHLDMYASYPIYSTYEADCDYENGETGEYCDGGFIRDEQGFKISYDGTPMKCPVCSERRLTGAGSLLTKPIPSVENGVADLKEPVTITTVDREALDYNTLEVQRIKGEIRDNCVGYGGKVQDKEAINETQVAANFESKTSVLVSLKTSFESIQKFVHDTICRLRYGEKFVESSINWGTEFYVFTVTELYEKYQLAKSNGASDVELDALMKQILETEYKNDPIMLQRMLLLRQIEPLRHYTLNESINMYEKGLATKEDLLLKMNFAAYIDRFERENISVVEFGTNIAVAKRIKNIKQVLISYVKEQEQTLDREYEQKQARLAKQVAAKQSGGVESETGGSNQRESGGSGGASQSGSTD